MSKKSEWANAVAITPQARTGARVAEPLARSVLAGVAEAIGNEGVAGGEGELLLVAAAGRRMTSVAAYRKASSTVEDAQGKIRSLDGGNTHRSNDRPHSYLPVADLYRAIPGCESASSCDKS